MPVSGFWLRVAVLFIVTVPIVTEAMDADPGVDATIDSPATPALANTVPERIAASGPQQDEPTACWLLRRLSWWPCPRPWRRATARWPSSPGHHDHYHRATGPGAARQSTVAAVRGNRNRTRHDARPAQHGGRTGRRWPWRTARSVQHHVLRPPWHHRLRRTRRRGRHRRRSPRHSARLGVSTSTGSAGRSPGTPARQSRGTRSTSGTRRRSTAAAGDARPARPGWAEPPRLAPTRFRTGPGGL